jgi:transcriptional regulator with XRE-family HTH domain
LDCIWIVFGITEKKSSVATSSLADHLGVNACYVSAMENGKKGAPSKQVLNKLIASLKLDAEEQEMLWDHMQLE